VGVHRAIYKDAPKAYNSKRAYALSVENYSETIANSAKPTFGAQSGMSVKIRKIPHIIFMDLK
jgi:hypothetical protein